VVDQIHPNFGRSHAIHQPRAGQQKVIEKNHPLVSPTCRSSEHLVYIARSLYQSNQLSFFYMVND